MFLADWISKLNRFRKEFLVLRRIDDDTEYSEEVINGSLAEQNILIAGESVKTSLEAKRKYIEAYAEKERRKREKKVARANRKGKPLDAEAVKILRDAEYKKRFEAFCHIRNLHGR